MWPVSPANLCLIGFQAASPFDGLKDSDTARFQNGEPVRRIQCAAVCVYPARIEDAIRSLERLGADKYVGVAAG